MRIERSPKAWPIAAFALILVLAVLFRVLGLDQIPAGLSHDEAYDALNAIEIMAGARPVFFDSNNGREALFMYLVAGVFGLFGVGPIALRLVSALAGVLAVGLLFGFARRTYGSMVALLAAGLMSVSFWPVFDSRVGLRASLLPAIVIGLSWALWEWAYADKSK